MAIGTDAAIEFFGTADALGNTTSAVTDGNFSDGTNDLDAFTNADDAEYANATLECTFSVAPDVGSVVELYARMMNIGNAGTEDAEVPDANFPHKYMGSFPVNDVTTAQATPLEIGLPNVVTSQVYDFYIKNMTGQTISASWELTITPKALGPHA